MTETPDSSRSNVLSVVLIVPDAKRRRALAAAMAGSASVIAGEFAHYPSQRRSDERGSLEGDVVIVDLDEDVGRAIGVIEDICGRNPSVTVMACSSQNDPTLLRRSMQAGAREFLIEPILPETVAEAFTRAFARRPRRKKAEGKLLVFVPTKGGLGVTTLAANFALSLTKESGARVVVVDMDLHLGEIALGLGMSATFSIADALLNAERLDWDFLSTLLLRHSSGLAVLGSPEEYKFSHAYTREGVIKLFRILREEFSYVVVDAGTAHGHLQEALFEMADKLYVITELTLPALRNAHRLISYISTRDENRRLEVVLNRFNSRQGDIDEASATKAIGRPVNWRIPNGYAAARAAQDNGVPLAMENSPITRVLAQMAKAACGKAPDIEKKSSLGFSFFGAKNLTETLET
jgi:Flp pilus assembly CpaE family ATPase